MKQLPAICCLCVACSGAGTTPAPGPDRQRQRRPIPVSSDASVAVAAPAIKVTKLTDKLDLLSTDQGEYTTNTLVFAGDDGVLLVDTQAGEHAAELERLVLGYGKGAPKYIINTHRHVEHVGGNAIFGEAPVVIAHRLVPDKLRRGVYIFEEFPPATYPDITVADSHILQFNGERIEIHAFAGSHDDNEIIVYFTDSRVVHLSSLVNGFNFPSVDGDGDPLAFAGLVERAIALLPADVVIVSGHNRTGAVAELRDYLEMLVGSTAAVRAGLDAGKDTAALQRDKVLAKWESYAGSYVSSDEWIEYLADAIKGKKPVGKPVYEALYRVWKERGAAAAVAHYQKLKAEHPQEYRFDELTLLVIGDKLIDKGHAEAAREFLAASLAEHPAAKLAYYAHYDLARAYLQLGAEELARQHCGKALALNPKMQAAAKLLEEINRGKGARRR